MFSKYMVRCKETSYYEIEVDAVSKTHAREIVHAVGLEGPMTTIAEDTLFDIIEVTQEN